MNDRKGYGIYGPQGQRPMQPARRHIIIDNMQQIVFIQVMEDIQGRLKLQEFEDIQNNGQWYKYVHKDILEDIRNAVTNGYQVRAALNLGMYDEEYYILQVTEIRKNILIKPQN